MRTLPVGLRGHQPVVRPHPGHGHAVLSLGEAPRPQHRDGSGVQVDRPGLPGLGLPDDDARAGVAGGVSGARAGLPHVQDRTVQVHVLPTEAGQTTEAPSPAPTVQGLPSIPGWAAYDAAVMTPADPQGAAPPGGLGPVTDQTRAWQDKAACRDHDNSDAWHADTPAESLPAQAVCVACPVAVECPEDAIATDARWGVWGGRSGTERGYGVDGTARRKRPGRGNRLTRQGWLPLGAPMTVGGRP